MATRALQQGVMKLYFFLNFFHNFKSFAQLFVPISCLVVKFWRLSLKSEIEEKAFCFSRLSSESDIIKTLTFSYGLDHL